MLNYINNKKLIVSTAKSTEALFTPDTHEHHLHRQVLLADQVLPLEEMPKVLGVTLDTHLTFTQHCNIIAVRVQQRNNVLKALAGSTWGCYKETLLATYQAIGRSILSYCCPVWTPSPKDTNWSRLQRAQNTALRIATGCIKMAGVAELHQQEAWELPVRQHNELNSQQFAIACHLPQHPIHQLCDRLSDDGRFRPNIQQYLTEDPLSNTSYMSAISIIHQMRSERPLKAAHQNYLMADRRPLLQPNRYCQGREELYWHNCAPVTDESVVSTWRERHDSAKQLPRL